MPSQPLPRRTTESLPPPYTPFHANLTNTQSSLHLHIAYESAEVLHFYVEISDAIKTYITRKFPHYAPLLAKYLEKALKRELPLELYYVNDLELDAGRDGELGVYEEIERRVMKEENRFVAAQYIEQSLAEEIEHHAEARSRRGASASRRRESIKSSASAMRLSPIHTSYNTTRTHQAEREFHNHSSMASTRTSHSNSTTTTSALILKIIYEPMEELEVRKEFVIILPQVKEFTKDMVGGVLSELEEIADAHEERLARLEDEIRSCHKRIEQLQSANRKHSERNEDLQMQITSLKKELEFGHLHNRALEKRIASLEKSMTYLGTQRESPRSHHTTSPQSHHAKSHYTPERHAAGFRASPHSQQPMSSPEKSAAFSSPIHSPSHAHRHQYVKRNATGTYSSPFSSHHSRLSPRSPPQSKTPNRSSPVASSQVYNSPSTRQHDVRSSLAHPGASPTAHNSPRSPKATYQHTPRRSPNELNGHSSPTSPRASGFAQQLQERYSPRYKHSQVQSQVDYAPSKFRPAPSKEERRPFEFAARSPFAPASREHSSSRPIVAEQPYDDSDNDHVSDTPPQSPYNEPSHQFTNFESSGTKPPFVSTYSSQLAPASSPTDEDAIRFSTVDLCTRFALDRTGTSVTYVLSENEGSGSWGSCIADCSWTSGIHQWEVRIDSLPDVHTRNIMLGVFNLHQNEFNVESQYCGETDGSFGIHFMGLECYHDNIPSSPFADQFMPIAEGSVVKLTLDLDRRTLSLSVDGEGLGVGFSALPSGEYTPCISLFHKGQRVSNISYNRLK